MALTKLTTDLIDSTIVTSVNGSTGAVTLGTGTDWQATPKTADFTAVAGEGYFVDTTSAEITVTLPSSPSAGDEVSIVDYAGTADTNNITITSSDNINGLSSPAFIDYERGGASMIYVDSTQGWIAYNATNETARALNPTPLNVDYLIVAGGGGGGNSSTNAYGGGGGGAGGLRTSYGPNSGGGASAETSIKLQSSTLYNISVGAGGVAQNVGTDSSFNGISASRGGYGGFSAGAGTTGGSGGGGGGPSGSGGNGTILQGYAGGDGGVGGYANAAGGGGADAAGSDGGSYTSYPQSTVTGGDGGAGLAVNIINASNASTASVGEVSGSDVYFAGGGGGGVTFHNDGTAGGIGGGADAPVGGNNGNNGTDRTGGGGSGCSTNLNSNNNTGGTGGSGVVILRYPSVYSITLGSGIVQASGSPFTEGTDKVSVFTGGTGTISFS